MSKSAFDELNEMQRLFVLCYTDLTAGSSTFGHVTKSAKKAGYSEKTAHVQGSKLLKLPKIQDAIHERKDQQMDELRNEFLKGAMIGYKTLMTVANDTTAPQAARVSAAKDLLDRAGFKPVEKKEIDGTLTGGFVIGFADPD